MLQRLTIEEMQALAAEKRGQCLSGLYVSARFPLRWRCEHGHEWEALPDNVRNKGSWCPACAGLQRHTIEAMHVLAASKNGKCLSSTYRGINTKLRWCCHICEHEWTAVPKSIIAGTWCPKCAGNLRGNLDDMQIEARKRGGICLSPQYLGDGRNLLWRCSVGHEFEATPSNVKRDKWCPKCATAFGERLTRAAFEQLFGHPFPRKRPLWLRNGHRAPMELDGYCQELAIAFEHQGEQHYTWVPQFQQTVEDFEEQRKRDEFKRQLCIQHDVTLIEIPEVPSRTSIDALANAIAQAVAARKPELGRVCALDQVDYEDVFRASPFSEKLTELQLLAKKKGGRLISTAFVTMIEPLEWECKDGHRWHARPNNIVHGKWCPHCAHCAKLTIEDMRKAAAAHGGVCLATEYRNNSTKVSWQCKQGHAFSAAFATVQRGHWCAVCKGVARYSLKDMHRLAAEHQGLYLSTDYSGMNAAAIWRCEYEHEFTMTPSAVKNRHRWCPMCKGSGKVT